MNLKCIWSIGEKNSYEKETLSATTFIEYKKQISKKEWNNIKYSVLNGMQWKGKLTWPKYYTSKGSEDELYQKGHLTKHWEAVLFSCVHKMLQKIFSMKSDKTFSTVTL